MPTSIAIIGALGAVGSTPAAQLDFTHHAA